MVRPVLYSALVASAVLVWACSSDGVAAPARGQGQLAMTLIDAPLPLDSIKEVNIFVERIDARRAKPDSTKPDSVRANEDLDGDHHENHMSPDSTLWVTIASPNKTFNLLALQNGVSAFLGTTVVDTGSFKAVRLIIDPTKSTVVLKDGTVLSTTSKPPIEFEQRGRHGLLVELNDVVNVKDQQTTTMTLDFRLGESVSLRGRTIRDGIIFRPVVKGSHHSG
jgi:hypothetical protein